MFVSDRKKGIQNDYIRCTVSLFTKVSFFLLGLSSSRWPRHPDPGAGPRHLIGGLGQQQFPGTDLPSNPGDFDISQGGHLTAGGRQEHSHQSDRICGVPHRNVCCHRANHCAEWTQTRRHVLLHGPVMR